MVGAPDTGAISWAAPATGVSALAARRWRELLYAMTIACGAVAVLAIPPRVWGQAAQAKPPSAYREREVKDGGRIVGRVFFEGDYPAPEPHKVTADLDVCGTRIESEEFIVDPASKGLANVVVRLENVLEGKPFAAAEAELAQLRCRYSPHVVVTRAGSTLKIVNKDTILHNIHAYRGEETLFNLAQPRQGQVTPKKVGDPGVLHVKCDVHAWMEGFVVVVDNPYVVITDATGRFEIVEVPPGEYVLSMWHEVLGTASKPVSVKRTETTTVDFTIGG